MLYCFARTILCCKLSANSICQAGKRREKTSGLPIQFAIIDCLVRPVSLCLTVLNNEKSNLIFTVKKYMGRLLQFLRCFLLPGLKIFVGPTCQIFEEKQKISKCN